MNNNSLIPSGISSKLFQINQKKMRCLGFDIATFEGLEKWLPGGHPGIFETPGFLLGVVIYSPPRKLAWQWKIHHLKLYFLLKMGMFQCHVSFQGRGGYLFCNFASDLGGVSILKNHASFCFGFSLSQTKKWINQRSPTLAPPVMWREIQLPSLTAKAPENRFLEKEIPIGNPHFFGGAMLVLGSVIQFWAPKNLRMGFYFHLTPPIHHSPNNLSLSLSLYVYVYIYRDLYTSTCSNRDCSTSELEIWSVIHR